MEITICSTRILTGNPSRPWAEALLVRDDRVVAVGSNDEIRAAQSGAAQGFELPGRLVTPGLVDAHLHFVGLGLSLQRLDLRDLPSIEDCRQRVRQALPFVEGRDDDGEGGHRAVARWETLIQGCLVMVDIGRPGSAACSALPTCP